MRTYKEVLEDGIHLLDAAAIEEAGLDAWLLLEYAAYINRAWYYAHMDEILDKKTESRYLEMCAKRAQHIPLQHITCRAYFMGYEFCVDVYRFRLYFAQSSYGEAGCVRNRCGCIGGSTYCRKAEQNASAA